MTAAGATLSTWTCPFCPLACDHLSVRVDAAAQAMVLEAGACARAAQSLSRFTPTSLSGAPLIDGQACSLAEATRAAAGLLRTSRQPLFAGLGTDVAATRALYPLACATGAICDSAGGDALMQGLRALQDRGQFTTTLAEVRTRADVIVFVGGLPVDVAPLIAQRCGIGEAQGVQRHVVVLGPAPGDEALLMGWAGAGVTVESIPLHDDLFTTLALLVALLASRTVPATPAALQALAARLKAARYGVLIGAPARLPAHGALVIEAVHQAIGHLNRSTRAAALWLGGGNGAATANQVFAWLSGLPLRSRAGPWGLEHEPLLFDAQHLIADAAVDALLWLSSFDSTSVPPANRLPMVVLGPPALASACRRKASVFIPVATPGVSSDGHVFRTDGTVLMPLKMVLESGLPAVSEVVGSLLQALQAQATA